MAAPVLAKSKNYAYKTQHQQIFVSPNFSCKTMCVVFLYICMQRINLGNVWCFIWQNLVWRKNPSVWKYMDLALPAAVGPHVPSMVFMVELSSASISFSNSSPLEDSLSPVRYSRISFFFWSGVPLSNTSSSSSELKQSVKHYTY